MNDSTSTPSAVSGSARGQVATDVAMLFLRLVLGVIFVAHGSQKVFGWFGGHGLEKTVAFMGQGGIPAPLAYLAAFTELLGGLAVLGGLLARLAATGLSVVMLVAVLKVHLANGLFADQKGFEYPLALLAMSIAVVLIGPGRLAIADVEARILSRRSSK